MYALVDGNNFYCSCERVFNPRLNGVPLVVKGNNDGNVIARSEEAKAIPIKMGQPYHQVQHLERERGLVGLSPNFELYGDMSARMHTVAAALGVHQEIYSIDESFVTLHGVRGDLTRRGRVIRARIRRMTGLPTCIGIGPTKTLAKLANHVAKDAERKQDAYPAEFAQVFNFAALDAGQRRELLAMVPVTEVWGVGRQIGEQLNGIGVKTALDLADLSPSFAQQRWSVVLARTVHELNGLACIKLEEQPPPKKVIASTRAFGRRVTDLATLEEAVTAFAVRAGEKLRRQGGWCRLVQVFIMTSAFSRKDEPYSAHICVPLALATNDSRALANAAVLGLRTIYQEGYRFAKAGVLLLDLDRQPIGPQPDLFGPSTTRDSAKLMAAMDAINARFGKGAVTVACAGEPTGDWVMKQSNRSPRYTTRLSEVLTVN